MSDSTVTISCPVCGRPMVERVNGVNGSRFMSCTGWPDDCDATAKVPAWLEMVRSGGTPLPGFEA